MFIVKLALPKNSIPMQPPSLDSTPVMVPVGWMGQTGTIYALDDAPTIADGREPASYWPIYMQTGTWQMRKGRWVAIADD